MDFIRIILLIIVSIICVWSICSPYILFAIVCNPLINNLLKEKKYLGYTILICSIFGTIIFLYVVINFFSSFIFTSSFTKFYDFQSLDFYIPLGILFGYFYLLYKLNIKRDNYIEKEFKRRFTEIVQSNDEERNKLIDYYERRFVILYLRCGQKFDDKKNWVRLINLKGYTEFTILGRLRETSIFQEGQNKNKQI